VTSAIINVHRLAGLMKAANAAQAEAVRADLDGARTLGEAVAAGIETGNGHRERDP
jgi:hypothetical protein